MIFSLFCTIVNTFCFISTAIFVSFCFSSYLKIVKLFKGYCRNGRIMIQIRKGTEQLFVGVN